MKLLILLFPLLLNAQLIEQDKQLHALGGGLVGGATFAIAREHLELNKVESIAFSVGVVGLLSVGKEFLDKPKTGFSWADIAYGTGSALVVSTTISIFENKY